VIGGSGLGLAISMEDANLHGGWLTAWGRPGLGAQFRLTLPRQAGHILQHSPLPLVPRDLVVPSPDRVEEPVRPDFSTGDVEELTISAEPPERPAAAAEGNSTVALADEPLTASGSSQITGVR
ncbi:MAG TPA: ATP-binding protein, partial [Propionibacteriaceae bacterium]